MPTIALLVESARGYGRGVLSGAAQYVQSHGRLNILHHPWALDEGLPNWLTSQRCDGILAFIETPETFRALQGLNVPLVDVCGIHGGVGIPVVAMSLRRASEMAVEHLLDRGFRNIGFCGFSDLAYCMQQRASFVETLRRHHIKPLIYEDRVAPGASVERRGNEARLDERQLAEWLVALPKPAGLMACNDICGRQVLNACLNRAIAVPADVAVIGVGNNEGVCESVDPPLSSIEPASELIGYQASALLDAMMCKPRGVHQTTDELNGVEIVTVYRSAAPAGKFRRSRSEHR